MARGYREVVLTGIHLGSYGRDLPARVDLLALVRRVLDETSLERLRLSSIEPMDVTEDLIALVTSSKRIARHFHLPLQSGVDRILAAMHRWYRAEQYARRLEWIHAWLPDAAIGADVIAGFPERNARGTRGNSGIYPRAAFYLSPRLLFFRAPRHTRRLSSRLSARRNGRRARP